ncbi:hypothetical protein ACFPN2_19975 [Steroidobacter flavus]|uniref:Uncharacterized protein n=1 Tax=Steroidobacter flavus TaxID=1842136 RepID=A0ABV8SWR8_9GAMM
MVFANNATTVYHRSIERYEELIAKAQDAKTARETFLQAATLLVQCSKA